MRGSSPGGGRTLLGRADGSLCPGLCGGGQVAEDTEHLGCGAHHLGKGRPGGVPGARRLGRGLAASARRPVPSSGDVRLLTATRWQQTKLASPAPLSGPQRGRGWGGVGSTRGSRTRQGLLLHLGSSSFSWPRHPSCLLPALPEPVLGEGSHASSSPAPLLPVTRGPVTDRHTVQGSLEAPRPLRSHWELEPWWACPEPGVGRLGWGKLPPWGPRSLCAGWGPGVLWEGPAASLVQVPAGTAGAKGPLLRAWSWGQDGV